MRTNIDIDDNLLEAAMRAGPFRTKKDAVEAGLQLLARKAAYQEILALRGKLNWDLGGDWTANEQLASVATTALSVAEPPASYLAGGRHATSRKKTVPLDAPPRTRRKGASTK
jgi:Arc/MetJ family transcription regulator